jgi:nitrogen regulatory protein PII
MKLITAVIQPDKLNEVVDELAKIGVSGLTITHASGYGQQFGYKEVYRGSEYINAFVAKTKLEIVVQKSKLNDTVQAIINAAYTGEMGDGKIWVTNVSNVVRIRTGETDHKAL